MKFALIGDDHRILPLLRAILADPQHALVCTAFAPACQEEIAREGRAARSLPTWEGVLIEPGLDAVIVAGSSQEVLNGARQLAADGKPLLVLPRAAQGVEFAYELSLSRDDRPVVLFPIFPLRCHPLCERLREWIDRAELGPLLHVQLERETPRTGAESGPPVVALTAVDEAFLQDVDLLRFLAGDFDQIATIRTGVNAHGAALVTTSLAGARAVQTTWSMRAGAADSGWRMRITGATGTAQLTGSDENSPLTFTVSATRGKPDVAETLASDYGPPLLARFAAAVAGEPVRPNWDDLLRAFELAEASRRSVFRRRTIDLHFDVPSERSNFKSQMTAIGCGVLLVTLLNMVALLVLAAAAGELGFPPIVMQVARFAVFAPLGIFLLLQLLILLTKPALKPPPSPVAETPPR